VSVIRCERNHDRVHPRLGQQRAQLPFQNGGAVQRRILLWGGAFCGCSEAYAVTGRGNDRPDAPRREDGHHCARAVTAVAGAAGA
jgi:hypothetical protein